MQLIPTTDGKGQNLSELKIEVFEISGHVEETIENSIVKKITGKDYSGMTLIAFVRRIMAFNHYELAKNIKKIHPNVQAIILLIFEESSTKISYLQIYPYCIKFKADFGLYCKTTQQKNFIILKRGMTTQFENSSTTDIMTLIPE